MNNIAALRPETRAEVSLSRQANDLARDLLRADARIYWTDLLLTAALTWVSLGAALALRGWPAVAAAAVCVLALYRAISFIHELTHLRPGEVPGFHTGWNLLIGVPFLTPSLLYEGVHMLHHAKDRYGTERDPEYLPLARLPAGSLLGFLGIALLAPVGTLIRFAVLAPLGFLVPAVRRFAVAKTSAMTINPKFAREDLERANSSAWLAQEIGCWLWSWTLIGLTAAGVFPLRAVLIAAAIFAVMTFVNQLRTAVAHAWENDGSKMSFEGQFLDTVNVPPPALLPAIWAPVGLRYHALHHLLPRLPYHNMAEAHRRLVAAGRADYRAVDRKHLADALARLIRSPVRGR
ncbi:fatty acid desaturase [Phenylobacterium sp.]|uniref:fatty acid desaturase family protein n=1 Tax=Phenylobacterium sp. TaxID=1871053 RepID=UPI002F92C195